MSESGPAEPENECGNGPADLSGKIGECGELPSYLRAEIQRNSTKCGQAKLEDVLECGSGSRPAEISDEMAEFGENEMSKEPKNREI